MTTCRNPRAAAGKQDAKCLVIENALHYPHEFLTFTLVGRLEPGQAAEKGAQSFRGGGVSRFEHHAGVGYGHRRRRAASRFDPAPMVQNNSARSLFY